MEYTGIYWYMDSKTAGERVAILKYEAPKREAQIPYCKCSACGKDIKRTMFVVQSAEDDVELYYLGADCIKKFK